MTWPVIWSPRADADLLAIIDHIATDNLDAAYRVVVRIRAHAERLEYFPGLGRSGRVEGTRELVVPRLPYFIVYEVHPAHVDILSVYHGKRRWPERF
jgi:toxin ParE1/3/4